jgi:methionyl aminopeptidase
MIFVKSQEDIASMRVAGQVVASALVMIEGCIKPGVTTRELDQLLEDFVLSKGVQPSFKGYMGYRHTSCISVNDVVVHGIPSNYALQVGDIVGVDIAVSYQGWHADAARTFGVHKISGRDRRLIDTARLCFDAGCQVAKAGVRLGDVCHAIQQVAESNGYGVVRDLSGHGIGRNLHEDPSVPNWGTVNTGVKLRSGMTLAIEPMINIGTYKVAIDNLDGWTCKTVDGSNSAHYENTIVITDSEPEILTL